jgi:hypothetical protein
MCIVISHQRQQQNEHKTHAAVPAEKHNEESLGDNAARAAAKYTHIYFGVQHRASERTVIAMNSDLLFIATPFVSRTAAPAESLRACIHHTEDHIF